jgi:ribose transport system substrate-binding protein
MKITEFYLTTRFFVLNYHLITFYCVRRKLDMKKIMVWFAIAGLIAMSLIGCGRGAAAVGAAGGGDLTFYIVPKVVHEWFDAVDSGAQTEAAALTKLLGRNVKVEYRAPVNADVTEQNRILEEAAATNPAGIAFDPLDFDGSRTVVEEIVARGIPVIIFDATVPGYTSIGNNFTEQAVLEADDLARRLGGSGKVAIMHGVPTAANHAERYNAMFARFKERWPNINAIDGGASQDNIEISQQQAAAIIAANPDLAGYLCVDAAAPIGIATAINEAGKKGKITFVGAENLLQILNFVKDGTIVCTYSTKPQMQGAMAVLMMLQAHTGEDVPQFIDTGILYIDEKNIDQWIGIVSSGAKESSAE